MKKIYLLLAATMVLLVTSCVTTAEKEAAARRRAAQDAVTPIMTDPEKKPAWVNTVPVTKTELAFVGLSTQRASRQDAQNVARANGSSQLVQYYGTTFSVRGRTARATYGLTSEVLDPEVVSQELEEYVAENVAQKLLPVDNYLEVYQNENGGYGYVAYVLMTISREDADKMLKEFCDQKAAEAQAKARAEQNAEKKQQFEKAAELFGGTLQSSLF